MIAPLHEGEVIQGAEDSGAYFKYMSEFVGFTEDDAATIRQSKPIIEKHLSEVIDKFYAHLLRYPPTRKFFLKKDGTIDQPYLELRMRHQANFWLTTCDANFDEQYARFLDYVGRAHTSRGADPKIYIAERYVIGQVGFLSHAISEAITKELRHVDEDFELRATESWNKLLMIVLEMLSRAYGHEREADSFDPIVGVDESSVERLAQEAFRKEHDKNLFVPCVEVPIAKVEDIPEGERKLVNVNGMSIGVFHHNGKFYALRNSCLHRGGPVATGRLEGDTLTCPWHGFQYNVTTGQLLVDPAASLDHYDVVVKDGQVSLEVPDPNVQQPSAIVAPTAPGQMMIDDATQSAGATTAPAASTITTMTPTLQANQFKVGDVAPGATKLVQVDGQDVAVYNVAGTLFATQDECTHRGGPLNEGDLDGNIITCPFHGSRFDVTTGKVVKGPAEKPVQTFKVTVEDGIATVTK